MKATVSWADDRRFIGTSGSGHSIVFGTKGSAEVTPGPSAMELLLIGTGGCSAFDVVAILEKTRQDIDDVIVELDADRAETDPKVFTRIHLHFIVKGRKVDPKHVERAIGLSVDKYCSASAMMAAVAKVTHDFEIQDIS